MKTNTWAVGVISGLVATTILKIITTTLYFLNLIALSEIEYAARFILHIPGKEMEPIYWIVGIITNYSLGAIFGVLSAYLFKWTGPDEKLYKIIGIGVLSWFFHLAIVPFLDPSVEKYSTARTALEFYIIYIIWASIAGSIIIKYLRFSDDD